VIVEKNIEDTRRIVNEWHRKGFSIGLVPTMGYFHNGHLELMKRAADTADKVVVSLFVNPTQFGPSEDLVVYPKDFDGDCAKAREVGADLLFCPEPDMVYAPRHCTEVSVGGLTEGLCGADRPGHFTGVATIVSKLFNIVRPNHAFFGEKDFQQLTVIRQLVTDLNFTVSIVGVPIVREPDGLAMSSRNAYLSPSEREAALVLFQALSRIKQEVLDSDGMRYAQDLLVKARELIETKPQCRVDYLEIVDEKDLSPVSAVKGKCRVLGAIRISDRIRLIDNLALYMAQG